MDRETDGAEGGATVLPDTFIADGFEGGIVVALVPAAVPVVPPSAELAAPKLRTPATAEPIPVAAIEPTATALPARNAEVPIKSPPERAGDPPSTAAKSLGICQQSIMKMIEAPMISSADMAGLELAAIFWASVIQSTERFIPVPIKR